MIDSNSMVTNPSKFQVMFIDRKKDQHLALEMNDDIITNSRELKLIGATLDSQLDFVMPQLYV